MLYSLTKEEREERNTATAMRTPLMSIESVIAGGAVGEREGRNLLDRAVAAAVLHARASIAVEVNHREIERYEADHVVTEKNPTMSEAPESAILSFWAQNCEEKFKMLRGAINLCLNFLRKLIRTATGKYLLKSSSGSSRTTWEYGFQSQKLGI